MRLMRFFSLEIFKIGVTDEGLNALFVIGFGACEVSIYWAGEWVLDGAFCMASAHVFAYDDTGFRGG